LRAGAEALAFGVLIFVMGTLMVINAWAVVDAKSAANASAREVSRFVTESVGNVESAVLTHQARQVAVRTLEGHGFAESRLGDVTVVPDAAGFVRCAAVDTTVRLRVPTVRVPLFGGFGGTYDVVGRARERIDPLRSGVEGEATCVG
jgi:hypothetical protein